MLMVKKIVLSIVAILFACVSAFAQNKQVTGTVTGPDGTPVVGATVGVEGTTLGTSTDLQGKYILSAPTNGVLVFSFIGYEDSKVAINGKTSVNVTLKEASKAIDDVIVIAFGEAKKEAFTGSVSVLRSEDLENRQTTNVMNALVGSVAGLQMRGSSGAPGSTGSINVRGLSSMYAGIEPLVIVDGSPYSASLSNIAQSDIESVTVLKDAASTSIYGTRAAFGVILITTKSAKKVDRVKVNYSNNFSWATSSILPDYPTVATQVRALRAANERAGLPNELFGMYLDTMLPYAEAWEQQNGGKKAGYREMRPFKSMSDVGDYFVNPDGSGAMYYANWDVQNIIFQNKFHCFSPFLFSRRR